MKTIDTIADEVTEQDIIDAGRATVLTSAVLKEWAGKGTADQLAYLHGFLQAETSSRTASRHARLLKAARLPVHKTLDGYDWTSVTFPADYDQQSLADLEFIDTCEDLVCYGDVGTGKIHLAAALVATACQMGMPAKFFTATALVDYLRKAKGDNRLDKELTNLAKHRLLAID